MRRGKRVVALSVAVVMLLSLSACGGFALDMTRAALKMSRLESVHTDVDIQLDLSMPLLLGQSLSMTIGLTGGVDSRLDPMLSRADLTLSTLGLERGLLGYLEKTGEDAVVYFSADEGKTWMKETVSGDEMPAMLNLKPKDLLAFRDCVPAFSEVGTETVQGSAAVRYDGELEGEFVRRALEMTGVLDLLGEALGVEPDEEQLAGLGSMPVSVWIDRSSGMIVRLRLEPTEVLADLVTAAADRLLQGGSLLGSRDLTLSRAVVTLELSQFNAVPEFSVPAAVKA